MICYRDRTYCGSKVHKPDCDRQFVADEAYWEWSKALGEPDGGPVAYADCCAAHPKQTNDGDKDDRPY